MTEKGFGTLLDRTKDGIEIYIWYGTFRAIDPSDNNKEIATSETMAGIKDLIREHLKQKRTFKPVDAIQIRLDRICRITSIDVEDSNRSVWVGYKDERGSGTHGKERVKSYYSSDSLQGWAFVKATESNLAILKKIQDMSAQIKQLHDSQDNLRKTFTDPVTYKDLNMKGENE